ncbi:hypothetical protein [Rhodocyclus tenuis]|uniref:Uncharacterized protein n=1 Tax=Rhodocyclus tenuis TaxID=1066 RepID=A0A840G9W7_RHOTE|nr:hypothetical protein [Rhodocyclus tenuis]MBB4249123.1 hypothetical protein [Rhodocyclus tenuis]
MDALAAVGPLITPLAPVIDFVAGLIPDGRIADLLLVLLVAEGLLLIVWRRLTRRGPALADLLINLGAGASLILALRVALSGADPLLLAGCLSLALLTHVADLVRRWRRG